MMSRGIVNNPGDGLRKAWHDTIGRSSMSHQLIDRIVRRLPGENEDAASSNLSRQFDIAQLITDHVGPSEIKT